MIVRRLITAAVLVSATPAFAELNPLPDAAISDPMPDAANPAGMVAFQLPTGTEKINALLYLAAGDGPKPALLLLHGFPGNEQNLDLAQAARRAGWDVLTLHYRGSWGSDGTFSFVNCIEDARNAARWLQSESFIKQTGHTPSRIAVAGHSMGGMMAARTMADVSGLAGAYLIDPWDISAEERSLTDLNAEMAFKLGLADDLKPLDGTNADALLLEMRANPALLDLRKTVTTISDRPLALVYAERGLGRDYTAMVAAASQGSATATMLMTDHSFSDHRIQLARHFVRWLNGLK